MNRLLVLKVLADDEIWFVSLLLFLLHVEDQCRLMDMASFASTHGMQFVADTCLFL